MNTVFLCLVLYLIITPLASLIFSSLKNTGSKLPTEVAGFTLANFAKIFSDPTTIRLFGNTLGFAVGTLVIGLAISVGLAYLLERTDIPGRQILRTLVLSPMAIPPMILAIAWSLLGNPQNGVITLVLRHWFGWHLNVYTIAGMMGVTALALVPSMYLMIAPQFLGMDPGLEDAAAVCGASLWRRTWKVTLGMARPALTAAALFFFVLTIEMFDVPAILGLPANVYLFSTLIYESTKSLTGVPNFGMTGAYGVILLAWALIGVLAYRRVVSQANRFQTITGKGFRPTRIALGRARWPMAGLVLLFYILAMLVPVLILIWASLLKFYEVPSWSLISQLSLNSYLSVLTYPGIVSAAVHSVIIAVAAATITMALATWAAWVSTRRRFVGSSIPVEGSFLIMGVPGVVVSLSILFLYLSFPHWGIPINLNGTLIIIIIAYATRFLSYGSRLMDAAIRQIQPELEEAGLTSGASMTSTVRHVVFPLLRPAITRGWLWVAVHAIREVPMAAMLYAVSNQTLAVALWEAWENSTGITFVSAFAVMLTIVSIGATWLIGRSSNLSEGIMP